MTIVNAVYGASLVADFNYTSGVNCVPAIVEFTDVSIDAVVGSGILVMAILLHSNIRYMSIIRTLLIQLP
ncbi:MAG: hypothetical protein IPM91_16475 [Bacteroidetes bacterium]|nr:hypothetical protein [Bacteroidota bacterium]